ncbi:CbbQ/NirQ/NorQ/GpvN family protein [Mycolicibacterium pulveris]|uniref:CbbQ/NirQ/NorQ/GpvN family protein n=1 Tax=Mycolicibacterium pulveris TaxID=36813 RepID=A0A7I7UH73_MYCPV|nr:CbbQ/NirQ/NorQ/GpvN family protein [Mycolicibacterium pulveris]BBY80221.1 CbbQ/NirQ/NorQ/GpvN family protein [Mycolicibacterium pulveris]
MSETLTMPDHNGVPTDVPTYIPVRDEVDVFTAAWRSELPVLLKGPTGCGKTRLVEHVAARLGVPLYTVCCHEDMTASDLLGRFVLKDSTTEWVDGPLTRAVRDGGICYLDEVVEARQDAIVSVHSLADHRRELNIERLGGLTLKAAPGFQLVVSYNPGYQSVLKDLKMSTRQRMVGIDLDFPPAEVEMQVLAAETGVTGDLADDLIRLGQTIRRLDDAALTESASTRALVATARLIKAGLPPRAAAVSAIASPLSDDDETRGRLTVLIESYLT